MRCPGRNRDKARTGEPGCLFHKTSPSQITPDSVIQKIISWQARHTMGCYKDTRVGILLAESQMYPAEAITEGKIERFWAKKAATPVDPKAEARAEVPIC